MTYSFACNYNFMEASPLLLVRSIKPLERQGQIEIVSHLALQNFQQQSGAWQWRLTKPSFSKKVESAFMTLSGHPISKARFFLLLQKLFKKPKRLVIDR